MTNELVSSVYTFVCDPDECDCLIQVTSSDGFGFPSGVVELTCPCGRKTTLLSVEHATIAPLTQTKGNTMDGMTTENLPLSDSEKYNPDMLVTYKALKDFSDAEYITDKVRNIEYELHNSRQNARIALQFQNKIASAKSIILDAYSDSDDQETLRAIAEALDIELTKEVEFLASIEVRGVITLNILEDYDLETEVTDALFADSNNGNIEVTDQEVCNVNEAY